MKEVIGWILVAISALGAVYTVGLIISYILLPKDLNDIDGDDFCRCHNRKCKEDWHLRQLGTCTCKDCSK